ncbi:hypothetical protein [Streptomyces sp. NPDC085529]|uniref:hypothetical protein n=1 Tax=Streptomyces sp. NPDC085529 TaxID=3365729 RepID=UPI0037D445A1
MAQQQSAARSLAHWPMASSRLQVPVAAWRWATACGLVPPADAGSVRWSRRVVEAADPEEVRAALRGRFGASWAADRLNGALGEPLPRCRPGVIAAAVGHLVRARLLAYLGGDVAYPDVHPDQGAALARRRDLPALLDRHVLLGPDQAAVRLGVRRTDFDPEDSKTATTPRHSRFSGSSPPPTWTICWADSTGTQSPTYRMSSVRTGRAHHRTVRTEWVRSTAPVRSHPVRWCGQRCGPGAECTACAACRGLGA